jgi:hypothetical protein
MVATTRVLSALETNSSAIGYIFESAWGTEPAGALQLIRYTSSTLAPTRTTQRPNEITSTREAAISVTTQVTAGGTINYALSANTFDELVFANVLQADWGSTLTINGSSGDITLTASSGAVTLSSTTPGKFASIASHSWIRLLGFTNTANNTFWFTTTGGTDSPDSISLNGPNLATAVTETPSGAAAKVRSCTIKNGTTFKSYFVEQQFSSGAVYMQYPGAYASRATLTGGLGAFMTGTVDLVAKTGQTATTTASDSTATAAPTGRVVDPIGGFVGCYFNGAALGTGVESFAITLENAGSAPEFQMGSSSAIGCLGGTFTASGTLRAYFVDFTLYQNVINETSGQLAFIVKDYAGYAYAFTFLDAKLNGQIAVGGPGQAVSVDYTIEAGPTTLGTFVIDRLAAS